MLYTDAYHKLSKYSCVIAKLIQEQVKNCRTYLTYETSYISFRNRKRVRHIINHTKVCPSSPEFGDPNSCRLLKCLITEAKICFWQICATSLMGKSLYLPDYDVTMSSQWTLMWLVGRLIDCFLPPIEKVVLRYVPTWPGDIINFELWWTALHQISIP